MRRHAYGDEERASEGREGESDRKAMEAEGRSLRRLRRITSGCKQRWGVEAKSTTGWLEALPL